MRILVFGAGVIGSLFVCYQITAGILLTGVLVKGFDQIQAPGVALSCSIGS